MLPGKGPLLRVGRHRMLQIFSHGEEVLDPRSTFTLCCSRSGDISGVVSVVTLVYSCTLRSRRRLPRRTSRGFIDFDGSRTAARFLLCVRSQSPANVGRRKRKQRVLLLPQRSREELTANPVSGSADASVSALTARDD